MDLEQAAKPDWPAETTQPLPVVREELVEGGTLRAYIQLGNALQPPFKQSQTQDPTTTKDSENIGRGSRAEGDGQKRKPFPGHLRQEIALPVKI